MTYIYRVTRAHGSNQGYLEEHGRDVLYVGYDHATAIQIFVESEIKDALGTPGSHYTETHWERAKVEAGCNPDELEWEVEK